MIFILIQAIIEREGTKHVTNCPTELGVVAICTFPLIVGAKDLTEDIKNHLSSLARHTGPADMQTLAHAIKEAKFTLEHFHIATQATVCGCLYFLFHIVLLSSTLIRKPERQFDAVQYHAQSHPLYGLPKGYHL